MPALTAEVGARQRGSACCVPFMRILLASHLIKRLEKEVSYHACVKTVL